jgi:hypothetical protein
MMAVDGKITGKHRRDFIVFIGDQKFTFVSFENALEALERVGIISENGRREDGVERQSVRLWDELVEAWWDDPVEAWP